MHSGSGFNRKKVPAVSPRNFALAFAASCLLAACQSATPGPPGGDALGAAGADVPMPPRVAIGQVQGRGLRSAMLGRQVSIAGVVTGNFSRGLGGVFVQDAGDGDAATADGIFVERVDQAVQC